MRRMKVHTSQVGKPRQWVYGPLSLLNPSSPQDQSIRIWRMNKVGQVACVAQGSGHTHSVGTICCSR